MKRQSLPCLLALVLFAVPLAVCAAGGAFEINQDCVAVGCFAGDAPGYPVTITQPGNYVLTSDLAPPGNSGTNAIEVSVAPVDIDLNGHTIDGGGSCAGTPAAICNGYAGYNGIAMTYNVVGYLGYFHVHNGRVRGFSGAGVQLVNASSDSAIEDMTISENLFGIGVGGSANSDAGHIRNCRILRNGNEGVATSSGPALRFFVDNSVISGNKNAGLAVGDGSVFVGNRIDDNGQYGIDCNGSKCAFGQNTFHHNNGGGANVQWLTTLPTDAANMGGNVCLDHASPYNCP
jgi:hypothetical protein